MLPNVHLRFSSGPLTTSPNSVSTLHNQSSLLRAQGRGGDDSYADTVVATRYHNMIIESS